MASQRKLKRIQLICSLEVFERGDGRLLGVVQDITVEGVGLLVREVLTPNQMYGLRVALPAEIAGQRDFEVTGRCAWHLPSSNPDLFLCGFQFIDVTPDVSEIIEELIRRYQR